MKKIASFVLTLFGLMATSAFAGHNIGFLIMQGNTPVLQHVIDSDNVNKPEDGMTPLNFAIALNKPDVVKILIAKKADLDLINPSNGVRPLQSAILMSGPEIQDMLLEGGANVNLPAKEGYYLLQIVIGVGNTELAKKMLDKGANVNSIGTGNAMPLMVASARGNLTVARWLVAKGARVNVEDSIGNSPLSLAAADNVELIKFLIDKGADPAYRNAAGRSIDEQRAFLAEMQKGNAPATK